MKTTPLLSPDLKEVGRKNYLQALRNYFTWFQLLLAAGG